MNKLAVIVALATAIVLAGIVAALAPVGEGA